MNTLITATLALLDETFTIPLKLTQRTGMTFLVRLLLFKLSRSVRSPLIGFRRFFRGEVVCRGGVVPLLTSVKRRFFDDLVHQLSRVGL